MIDLHLKRQSEHPIQQRRAYDNGQSVLASKLRSEFLEEQHAKWENRGQQVSREKEIKQRLNQLKAEARHNLAMRKG